MHHILSRIRCFKFICILFGFCGLLQAQIPEGEFIVTASSTLPASSTSDFSAENMFDGTSDSWSEGEEGDGTGAYFNLELRYPDHLKFVTIKNGFGKSKFWASNGRVQALLIRASDGKEYNLELLDRPTPQIFGMYEPFTDAQGKLQPGDVPYDSAFHFQITAVYPGTKWEDLCITEIGLNQWFYQNFTLSNEYISKCLLMEFLDGILDVHGDLYLDPGFSGIEKANISNGYLKRNIASGDGTSGMIEYQVLIDSADYGYYIFQSGRVQEVSQESLEGKMDASGNPIMVKSYSWSVARYDTAYSRFYFLEGDALNALFDVLPVDALAISRGDEKKRDDVWLCVGKPGTIAAKIHPVINQNVSVFYVWNGEQLVLQQGR